MNIVKEWLAAANREEQQSLAALANTSRAHLGHLANGRRSAGPELAAAIEKGSRELCVATRGRLKVLLRTELCAACGRCDYAAKCEGGAE